MNIVLYEPEIPSNTGNIGRTCVATGSALHLIEPLGFRLTDKMLKRSGMDYWNELSVTRYINWQDFIAQHEGVPLFFATTKARRTYADATYPEDAFLVFGKESAGLPEELLVENEARCVRIPMYGESRSLNLANSVAVVLYEALRQNGFDGLEQAGALHRLSWTSSR